MTGITDPLPDVPANVDQGIGQVANRQAATTGGIGSYLFACWVCVHLCLSLLLQNGRGELTMTPLDERSRLPPH